MATFFSNNLDFFASCPGYSPRGGVVNPLQADSVIDNKRRAAAYMSAIRKVTVLIIEQIEMQKSFKVEICAPELGRERGKNWIPQSRNVKKQDTGT